MTDETRAETYWRELRLPGLAVIGVIVVLGIVPGAGFFHYKAPRVKAEVLDKLRDTSSDPNARLDIWLASIEPQVRQCVAGLRFSSKHPWIVTHTLSIDGRAPEIWGLDLREPEAVEIVREGLRVEVRLPQPVLLGHGVLRGDNARHIPRYTRPEDVLDPAARAERVVSWFLPMIKTLPRDIPGAEMVVRVRAAEPASTPGAD